MISDFPLRVFRDAFCVESSMSHPYVRALLLNLLDSLLLNVYDTNIALNIKTVNFVVMLSSLDDCVGAINFEGSFCKLMMSPGNRHLLFSLGLRHEVEIISKFEDTND